MLEIYKYPRTHHLELSKLQNVDADLSIIPFAQIKDHHLVIEEKVDGANCGISFTESGEMRLQSRGHYLTGGAREKQFDLFKTWAMCHQFEFYQILQNRYILYGEWLYAKHTVFYDALKHYFMEFDIYDKERKLFLSTNARRKLLQAADFITSVLVLHEGKVESLATIQSMITPSHFKTANSQVVLEKLCRELGMNYEMVKKQTDCTNLMEGLYIKIEDQDQVIERCKFVRACFLNTILDADSHWMDRPIMPNQLRSGIDIFS